MDEVLDLSGVRIYSRTKDDAKDAMNLIGEEVYASDDVTFESYTKTNLVAVRYADDITYPFVAGDESFTAPFEYLIFAKDVEFKNEKKIDMDFVKWLRSYSIIYLPELPPEDVKAEDCTVAIPGEKLGQFKLYIRHEGRWVFVTTINKPDFDFKGLKEVRDDLENIIKKLNKITSNIENDALSSKLSKITSKVLQAKYELAEDILEPVENRDTEMWKGLTNEYLKNS